MPRIGVLGLQGDFLEHVQILRGIEGVAPLVVKSARDLGGVDALVIPGGESTVIGRLLELRGLGTAVADLVRGGIPVLGTCAGAILLAEKARDREVGETGQPLLRIMSISVLRNAFGRQASSFEAELDFEGLGRVRGAFIRAPVIEGAWGGARIVSRLRHPALGEVGAAAVQGNSVAVTFHPEIVGETKIHRLLADMARGRA